METGTIGRETVGQRIRRARIRQGLSQSELAARIRVSQPTIANWEQDSHAPRTGALDKVAETLGVETFWLMNGGQTHKNTVLNGGSFLSLPIRHAPLFDWPAAGARFDPMRQEPRDYFAISTKAENCFALTVRDPAVEAVFPEGSIAIFDAAPRQMADGDFHLFHIGGEFTIRRWRASPQRLQASPIKGNYDTIFVEDEAPHSLGRAIFNIRPL